MGPNVVSVEDV